MHTIIIIIIISRLPHKYSLFLSLFLLFDYVLPQSLECGSEVLYSARITPLLSVYHKLLLTQLHIVVQNTIFVRTNF